jgi:NAD(P)-dependent dehydrogenase (short-subunit alcohol dehydrogenase family)
MAKESIIALVTGANKGIGFEIVRQLARDTHHVFLAARNAEAGRAAAQRLASSVEFVELDITQPATIVSAVARVEAKTQRLDVLINNAGVLLPGDDSVLSISDQLATQTFNTNTLGALRLSQAFARLLHKSSHPRIINVSSGGGQLSTMSHWAPAYSISKAALNALTVQLAAALPQFAVNSVCPGWVRTDMGGGAAPRSVEQGADTVVWLATEAPQTLSGKFLRDREIISW